MSTTTNATEAKDVEKPDTESAPCSSHCSTLAGKWSISTDEENYHGTFDTAEEAIEEGKQYGGTFWVGQCTDPMPPEEIWDAGDWLEQVRCHDDYSGDWAEGAVSPNKEQCRELEGEVRKVMAAWLDRHGLRPTHWNIDHVSVRKIDGDDA